MNNRYDFYIYAGGDSDCDNELINVTGTDNKPIVYFNDTVTIQNWNNNASEIILCNADNSVIDNVTMDHTDKENNGIFLVRTDNVDISNIGVYDTYYGIYLYRSSSNTLTNITANSNTYYGINLY